MRLCFVLLLIFFSCLACMVSCLKGTNSATVPSGSAVPFCNLEVLSVLNKCGGSRCHSSGGNASGEWFYDPGDYERSIKNHIDKIVKEAGTYGRGMAGSHYGNLSKANVDTLVNWYKRGAPNCSQPSQGKIIFRYGAVRNIFDSKCASCHRSGSGSASSKWSYDTSDYVYSIKSNANTIYNVTKTVNSLMASPSYGNLSQVEVDTIVNWYNAGYLSSN